MKIIILGAGVVGVSSTWYLAKAGHEVTVIDCQPRACFETSFANGGQISVYHAKLWSNPHAPLRPLSWMGREDATLLFRWRFEPALKAARPSLVGWGFTVADESGDALKFTENLAVLCALEGVDCRYSTTIEKLQVTRGGITGVQVCSSSDVEVLKADAYVVALESYTPLLLPPLKINLPVYPAKSYSATLNLSEASVAQTVAMTNDGHKLVFSRLGNQLRIAGTAEFNGYNTELNDVRCSALMQRTHQLFPELHPDGEPEF